MLCLARLGLTHGLFSGRAFRAARRVGSLRSITGSGAGAQNSSLHEDHAHAVTRNSVCCALGDGLRDKPLPVAKFATKDSSGTGAGAGVVENTPPPRYVSCAATAAAVGCGAVQESHRVVDPGSGVVLLELSNGIRITHRRMTTQHGQVRVQVGRGLQWPSAGC